MTSWQVTIYPIIPCLFISSPHWSDLLPYTTCYCLMYTPPSSFRVYFLDLIDLNLLCKPTSLGKKCKPVTFKWLVCLVAAGFRGGLDSVTLVPWTYISHESSLIHHPDIKRQVYHRLSEIYYKLWEKLWEIKSNKKIHK